MFTLPIIILHLLLVTVDSEVFNEDCCPLEWRRFDTFPPSDAVLIGKRDGIKRYWVRNQQLHSDFYTTGIRADNSKEFWFIDSVDKEARSSVTPNTEILTNPLNCTLDWWRRSYKYEMPPELTNEVPIKTPSGGGFEYLAVWNEDRGARGGFILDRQERSSDHQYFFSPDNNEYYWKRINGPQVLKTKCRESVRKNAKVELADLQFSLWPLVDGKSGIALQSATIMNQGSTPSTTTVSLKSDISYTVQVSVKNQFGNKFEISSSANGGISIPGLGDFGATLGQRYEFSKLTKTGKLDIKSERTEFKFEQKVKEPPKSKTVIRIMTTPVHGNVPITAVYRISSPDYRIWSNDAMKRAFRRIGFTDVQNMYVTNGTLYLPYKGEMAISAGYETHVNITSYSLEDGSIIESYDPNKV